MAILSISAAARAAGVSRTTLYEKIKDGELSRTPEGVDTSELLRVFGELQPDKPKAEQGKDVSASREDSAHTEWLQGLVDKQQAIIERQANELREATERADNREQTWHRQLERVTALLPAPEEQPEPKRGFFNRLFTAS